MFTAAMEHNAAKRKNPMIPGYSVNESHRYYIEGKK